MRAMLAPEWLADFTCCHCGASGGGAALVIAGELAVCVMCVIELMTAVSNTADSEEGRELFLPGRHSPRDVA